MCCLTSKIKIKALEPGMLSYDSSVSTPNAQAR